MSNPLQSALNSKLGKKVVDVTSDVLSAPKRAYLGVQTAKNNADTKVLKSARAYNNAPDWNEDGTPTDAFKTRSLAKDIVTQRKRP